jgi:N-acetylmuramoyl-L-alanine amidase
VPRRVYVAGGVVLVIAASIVFGPSRPGTDLSGASASRTAVGTLSISDSGHDHAAGGGASEVALDSSRFAAGACVAFAPTGQDRKRTAFLDPGHGGPDPGAEGRTGAGKSVDEATLTLPVALAVARKLRADGYRVVLSRTTDNGVAPVSAADATVTGYTTRGKHRDLLARIRCADLARADALVSIHFDAYDSSDVRGAVTLYDTVRPFAAANRTLATLLQHHVVASLVTSGWQVPDRGIGSDTIAGGGEQTARGHAYGHLDILGPPEPQYLEQATMMPGALVEPLFITNPAEADVAASPAGQQAIARGITLAVERFLR